MMFVICSVLECKRKKRNPLAEAYESVDRILLWTIPNHFGLPRRMGLVIRQFQDGMRVFMQLDEGVFMLLLFNIFTAVIHVAYTSFKTNKDIMDTLVDLIKTGAGTRREEITI